MNDLLPQHASKEQQATKGEWENLNVDEDGNELSMNLLLRCSRFLSFKQDTLISE